ncbi:hypothetical protein [Alistipes sp. ZOR0009]|uniref:hypothetical protein n=1 Tax=Alistipes sp. ZOR0009 TaxID=1339253 RepID=UPI0006476DF5|nr:hypothetical protein [Alistipes sp. ZOR0009]
METNTLITIAKSANSIHSLLTGGAFGEALNAIALVELEAARNAYQSVSQSKQPREALNRVLTHLESAHVAFRKTWSTTGLRVSRYAKASFVALWDAYVCCLMAAIHKALGDNNQLLMRSFKWGEDAIQFEKSLGEYEEGIIALVNPMTYIDIFSSYSDIMSLMSEDKFEEFKRNILN